MSHNISVEDILRNIEETFPGLRCINTWGETSFFYNPNNVLKRGVYFCTIKEKDGENDAASNLNREGVFRVNFGISPRSFLHLFNQKPIRPQKGGIIAGNYDFTELNSLMPHPVYGWGNWVAILNPSGASWENVQPLLNEGYELAVKRYQKRALKA